MFRGHRTCARATLSSFSLGVSHRSRRGAVRILKLFAQPSCHFVRVRLLLLSGRSCAEILPRCTEILPRGLLQRSCQESSFRVMTQHVYFLETLKEKRTNKKANQKNNPPRETNPKNKQKTKQKQ